MKKYEYVNVEMISKFVGAKSESHRSIIETDIAEYGKIKNMDLIFEIDC